MGSQLALPVAILHAFAFGLGYWMCRLLGFNEKTARTVSIETGAVLTARQLSVLHAANLHGHLPGLWPSYNAIPSVAEGAHALSSACCCAMRTACIHRSELMTLVNCRAAGMQSAALGFMLAQAHFADALVAVPSAVSVVFMVSSYRPQHSMLGWTCICSCAAVTSPVLAVRAMTCSGCMPGHMLLKATIAWRLAQALGGSGLAVFWRNRPVDEADGMQKSL